MSTYTSPLPSPLKEKEKSSNAGTGTGTGSAIGNEVTWYLQCAVAGKANPMFLSDNLTPAPREVALFQLYGGDKHPLPNNLPPAVLPPKNHKANNNTNDNPNTSHYNETDVESPSSTPRTGLEVEPEEPYSDIINSSRNSHSHFGIGTVLNEPSSINPIGLNLNLNSSRSNNQRTIEQEAEPEDDDIILPPLPLHHLNPNNNENSVNRNVSGLLSASQCESISNSVNTSPSISRPSSPHPHTHPFPSNSNNNTNNSPAVPLKKPPNLNLINSVSSTSSSFLPNFTNTANNSPVASTVSSPSLSNDLSSRTPTSNPNRMNSTLGNQNNDDVGIDLCLPPSRCKIQFVAGIKQETHTHTNDFDNDDTNIPITTTTGSFGQDAWLVVSDVSTPSAFLLGIADGVGGWRSSGVDSGIMSKALMDRTLDFVRNEHKASDKKPLLISMHQPKSLVERAYDRIIENGDVEAGSTTACLLSLIPSEDHFCQTSHTITAVPPPLDEMLTTNKSLTDPNTAPRIYLHTCNLGDSGFCVIRGKRVVFHSSPQRDIHHVHQLAVIPESLRQQHKNSDYEYADDKPSDALCACCELMENDVVILASDGLWDNIQPKDEIVNVNGIGLARLRYKADAPERTLFQHQKIAGIIDECRNNLTGSVDVEKVCEGLALSAVELMGLQEGKPDDLTLIVTQVKTRKSPFTFSDRENTSSIPFKINLKD